MRGYAFIILLMLSIFLNRFRFPNQKEKRITPLYLMIGGVKTFLRRILEAIRTYRL